MLLQDFKWTKSRHNCNTAASVNDRHAVQYSVCTGVHYALALCCAVMYVVTPAIRSVTSMIFEVFGEQDHIIKTSKLSNFLVGKQVRYLFVNF